MAQRVFLVHGWSVQSTTTYQALHRKLAEYGDFTLEQVFLGRYVSLDDRVELRDLAKAMHAALDDKLDGDWTQPFHIITHSTGALVSRHWIVRHYTGPCCQHRPLINRGRFFKKIIKSISYTMFILFQFGGGKCQDKRACWATGWSIM